MNQTFDAALHLKDATETVKVLTKLCHRHPDLRPALKKATHVLREALLDLQGTLQPAAVPAKKRPTRPRYDPHEGNEQGSLAKALLLEVILRAASDWVLYKEHPRLMYQDWAKDAATWLFEEAPGHPNWRERARNGKTLTSFVAICEVLDFDPELVRRHIRSLTKQRIVSMGRPAEYRRKRAPTPEYVDTADVRSFFASEGGLL